MLRASHFYSVSTVSEERYRGLRIAKVKLTRRQLVRAGIRSCGIAIFSLSLSRFIPRSRSRIRGGGFFFFLFLFLEAKLRWISSNTTTKGRVADHTRPVYRAPIPPSRLFATLVETSSIPALFLSPVNRDFSFGGNISRGRDEEEFTPELFEGGWTNCSPSLSPDSRPDPFGFRETKNLYLYLSRKFQQFYSRTEIGVDSGRATSLTGVVIFRVNSACRRCRVSEGLNAPMTVAPDETARHVVTRRAARPRAGAENSQRGDGEGAVTSLSLSLTRARLLLLERRENVRSGTQFIPTSETTSRPTTSRQTGRPSQ